LIRFDASQSTNNLASYIWSLADLLRGDFKQSQYGRIILPFTLLRRLECVLANTKADVLAEVARIAPLNLTEVAQEKFLVRASNLSFYNTSKMDL
jgi:type I restriction enzyme M protein